MANKNFNFNIPIPIIVFAYIFCQPVGVVLTILKIISASSASHNNGNRTEEHTYSRNSTSSQQNRSYTVKSDTDSVKKANAENKDAVKSSKRKTSPAVKWLSFGSVSFYLFSIMFWIMAAATHTVSRFFPIAAAAALAVVGSGCVIGTKIAKDRDTRLATIRAMIGNKKSMNLTKLALACKTNIKKIRRDVQYMIDNGEFGDSAYIDLSTNNFMKNPDAEPDDPEAFDYRSVYGDILRNSQKNSKDEDEENDKNGEKTSDEDNFNTIIREIRRLNDEIEDGPVSERIYKIEAHTQNIFDYVTDHPEAMPQIRTFMNYYLPTTLKLLESYSRIERVGVAGENMKRSKENIEKTVDLLVSGFERQVDQLFKNESIDISSDISVLEQMMQKDGLSGEGDIAAFVEKETASETDEKTDKGYSDEICDDITAFGSAAAQKAPEQK